MAQPFGFGAGEVAFEGQRLGPGEQVVRERDQGEPDLVVGEAAEGQVRQPGVFVGADVVFDPGAAAVAARQLGDVAGPGGEDRLEAVALMVGERQTGLRGAGARGERSSATRQASPPGRSGR